MQILRLRATVFSSYTLTVLRINQYKISGSLFSRANQCDVSVKFLEFLECYHQIELLIEISWRAIDYAVRSSSNFRVCVTNPRVYTLPLTEPSISGGAFLWHRRTSFEPCKLILSLWSIQLSLTYVASVHSKPLPSCSVFHQQYLFLNIWDK